MQTAGRCPVPLEIMNEIKKVPKKLRGREIIMVDEQILRRREMLRKKGIVLGTASRYRERVNAKEREERALPPPEKRKWF